MSEDVNAVVVAAEVVTVVDTLALLLPAFRSGVALATVATLVRTVPTASAPLTVAVSVSVCGVPVTTVPTVHTPAAKVPWLGVALTKVRPAGSVSFTVTVAAGSGPALLTVIV